MAAALENICAHRDMDTGEGVELGAFRDVL